MKPVRLLSAILLFIIGTSGCDKELMMPDTSMADEISYLKGAKSNKGNSGDNKVRKATGSVELEWKGAEKGGDKGNKPDDLLVFFEVSAHEGNDVIPPKGELIYRVLESDFTLHREIIASVDEVSIDMVKRRGCILATVVYDSKGCSGGGNGGHESGCSSGGHDGTEGGCSGEDEGTEGGCGGEDTGGDEGTIHDEGCSHETTGEDGTIHEEGGCSGADNPGGEEGGNPGGGEKGNPLSGKNCRLGQVIAVKLHDRGTPGTNGDGITWKWFDPVTAPSMVKLTATGTGAIHLCEKTIIGGNLVIHDK